jgi:UDP-GlcNAc:undecaprenyl-phosphate/decaprenyl-phosphate GlcNAc-1-phosphate transferase
MPVSTDTFVAYLVFFGFALFFSWLINSLFLKFASTLGMRNKDETVIRWSKTSKPSLGGISFYIIFLISLASYPVIFGNGSPIILDHQLLGFLAATTMAFLMGLADDAYNTKPLLKFIVQVLCAVILIGTGTFIRITPYDPLNYVLTVIWVVGIMNSINMLDNMDAITTLVSICIIGFGLVTQYINNDFDHIYIVILIGVLGALMGFLFFNWHPSKMFMGDTGSQFLGLILSAIGIVCFWNAPDMYGHPIQTKQFLVTALIFIIPACDTAIVVMNRLSHGRSPFVGGKDHTTHNLFFMGVTEKRIAALFVLITVISALLCLLILKIRDWNYLHILLFSAWFIAVFSALFYVVRKKSGKLKK